MKKYDYLIVGCGPFGAVFAQQATAKGKRCLIIEKRDHIGGNLYCEDVNGIHVHKYGAHIFHTNSRDIWDYVNRFAEFNRYTNSPIANYKGEIYNMPFNMNTFNKMWGVVTPEQARAKIAEQQAAVEGEPRNLEEQAIRLVGSDIYTKLVKGYTEKQWGRDCTRAARLYHQAAARALHLRQQLFQRPVSRDPHRRLQRPHRGPDRGGRGAAGRGL